MVKQPGKIANKAKRGEVYQKFKAQKKVAKKKVKVERKKHKAELEELGEEPAPKQIPRTVENTRIHDDTAVSSFDIEVLGDEKDDEFSEYYANTKKPKIMITTRPKCSKKLYSFIADLMQMIPNAFYYPRGIAV